MSNILNIATCDFTKFENNTIIAVDTNVLLCMFYEKVVFSNETSLKLYQTALEKFIENNDKIKLITTTININEAFHVIEKTEFDIYLDTITDKKFTIKDYRMLSEKRAKLKKEYKFFWQQVCRYMRVCEYNMTKNFIREFYNNADVFRYDCLDAALVDYCKQNNVTKILTDDSDYFGYDNEIEILTANPKMSLYN